MVQAEELNQGKDIAYTALALQDRKSKLKGSSIKKQTK